MKIGKGGFAYIDLEGADLSNAVTIPGLNAAAAAAVKTGKPIVVTNLKNSTTVYGPLVCVAREGTSKAMIIDGLIGSTGTSNAAQLAIITVSAADSATVTIKTI